MSITYNHNQLKKDQTYAEPKPGDIITKGSGKSKTKYSVAEGKPGWGCLGCLFDKIIGTGDCTVKLGYIMCSPNKIILTKWSKA